MADPILKESKGREPDTSVELGGFGHVFKVICLISGSHLLLFGLGEITSVS